MASGYALPHVHAASHGRGPSMIAAIEPHSYTTPNHSHTHAHSHSHNETLDSRDGYGNGQATHSQRLPMKGRVRGESDLSRPAGTIYISSKARQSRLVDALTGAYFTLQFTLLYAGYEGLQTVVQISRTPLDGDVQKDLPTSVLVSPSALVVTAFMTGLALVISGAVGYFVAPAAPKDKRRASDAAELRAGTQLTVQQLRPTLRAAAGIALPIYACLCLEKPLLGLLLHAALISCLPFTATRSIKHLVTKSKWLCLAVVTSVLLDLSGLTSEKSLWSIVAGYAHICIAATTLQAPVVEEAQRPRSASARPHIHYRATGSRPVFIATKTASAITILCGVSLAILAAIGGLMLGPGAAISGWTSMLLTLSAALTSIVTVFGDAESLRSGRASSLASAVIAGLLSLSLVRYTGFVSLTGNALLALLFVLGAVFDQFQDSAAALEKASTSTGHTHAHNPNVSSFTAFLLSKTQTGSLIHDILCEKDSRRIAYFTFLNFAFMLVQGFYGWASGSLGLLSDTVHMFFDCLALIVGLAASVASKWPTSPEKPYGWSKLNTLAGFGNGVFLMLVSVEFVWGAIEGILERNELRRVEELLVVSTLGLIVNMIGLLAFGHAHAGHDHGHSHGHGHSHSHAPVPAPAPHDHGHNHSHSHASHSHSHSHASHSHDHIERTPTYGAEHHDHDHDHAHNDHHHDRSPSPTSGDIHIHNHAHDHHHDHSHSHTPSHFGHGHSPSYASIMFQSPPPSASLYPPTDPTVAPTHTGHDNENMHGIYLHIAADAGGSLAVIISTTLTLWKPWYLWDPLATIIIAALIFMAAVPLVKESAKKLLLIIPEDLEYELKSALQELVMIRGVSGYAAPRFWVEDNDADGHDHHHHGHSHGHSHAGHDHGEHEGKVKLRGSLHVFASKAASIEDIRERVGHFFRDRKIDAVVQVEREGEGRCWCGGGPGGI